MAPKTKGGKSDAPPAKRTKAQKKAEAGTISAWVKNKRAATKAAASASSFSKGAASASSSSNTAMGATPTAAPQTAEAPIAETQIAATQQMLDADTSKELPTSNVVPPELLALLPGLTDHPRIRNAEAWLQGGLAGATPTAAPQTQEAVSQDTLDALEEALKAGVTQAEIQKEEGVGEEGQEAGNDKGPENLELISEARKEAEKEDDEGPPELQDPAETGVVEQSLSGCTDVVAPPSTVVAPLQDPAATATTNTLREFAEDQVGSKDMRGLVQEQQESLGTTATIAYPAPGAGGAVVEPVKSAPKVGCDAIQDFLVEEVEESSRQETLRYGEIPIRERVNRGDDLEDDPANIQTMACPKLDPEHSTKGLEQDSTKKMDLDHEQIAEAPVPGPTLDAALTIADDSNASKEASVETLPSEEYPANIQTMAYPKRDPEHSTKGLEQDSTKGLEQDSGGDSTMELQEDTAKAPSAQCHQDIDLCFLFCRVSVWRELST
jgi:hypothetical protein